jgi:hypothetical protein
VNRYESPASGRFLSPDRLGGGVSEPGSWNKYAYTRGDPVNRTDANGLCDSDFCVTATGYLDGEVDTSFFLGKDRPQMDLGSDGICSWELPNCGGVTAPATGGTSSYFLALQRAKLAQSTEAKLRDKGTCDKLLSALRTWQGAAVGFAELQRGVAAESFQDGVDNPTRMVSLFSNSSPANQAFAAIQYGSSTVGQWLASHQDAAVACAGCNLVFLDYQYFGGGALSTSEATLMHEALHNITGLSDGQLLNQLKSAGDDVNTTGSSQQISNLIERNCL